jgi:hypothetical protein
MTKTAVYFTRTNTPAASAQIGDVVSYEDMSNPDTYYTVVDHVTDAWGTEARMVNLETGRISTNSMRGAGWVLAERRETEPQS